VVKTADGKSVEVKIAASTVFYLDPTMRQAGQGPAISLPVTMVVIHATPKDKSLELTN